MRRSHAPDVNGKAALHHHVIGEQGRHGDIGLGCDGKYAESDQGKRDAQSRKMGMTSDHGFSRSVK